MTTQAEFLEQHAVNGDLTEEQMAQMLLLPEGDTGKLFTEVIQDKSGGPNAAATTDDATGKAAAGEVGKDKNGTTDSGKTDGDDKGKAADKQPPNEAELNAQNAVIQAKDGKHTIPFEKLEQERTARQDAERRAEDSAKETERLRQELAAAKAAPGSTAAAKDGAADTGKTGDVMSKFGDFSDEALAKGIDEVAGEKAAAAVAAELKRLGLDPESQAQAAQKKALETHFETIYKAHPDADSIVESKEFGDWSKAQPPFTQRAIAQALSKGTTTDIVEVFTTYKAATAADKTGAATEDTGTKVPTAEEAAAAAQAVIAKAGTKTPTSLSEIPAGSAAHVDPTEALLAASDSQLMTTFLGKSPDEIHRLLNKTL